MTQVRTVTNVKNWKCHCDSHCDHQWQSDWRIPQTKQQASIYRLNQGHRYMVITPLFQPIQFHFLKPKASGSFSSIQLRTLRWFGSHLFNEIQLKSNMSDPDLWKCKKLESQVKLQYFWCIYRAKLSLRDCNAFTYHWSSRGLPSQAHTGRCLGTHSVHGHTPQCTALRDRRRNKVRPVELYTVLLHCRVNTSECL